MAEITKHPPDHKRQGVPSALLAEGTPLVLFTYLPVIAVSGEIKRIAL